MKPRFPPSLVPFKLKTQLGLFMVTAIMLAVLFGYVGISAWSTFAESKWAAQMSPNARLTVAELRAGRVPSGKEMVALSTESARLNIEAAREENLVLVVLTLVASIIGVGIGLLAARRLSDPLETLADTARLVAAGDFSARARPRTNGAGETARLVTDFNQMAESLQRANRQLKESSAAIAHELRTPLTILRGRLQGLQDGVFLAGGKEISGLIRQVDSLARIVDDLQTVSNAEVGALQLRLGALDLAEETAAVVQTFAPDLIEAGVQVELDLRPSPVEAEAARVRQAILAVLENVRRHAAEGGCVRVETCWLEGGIGVVRIMDRGQGFPAGLEQNVFQPFWRADSSRSRESGGTGLGMAVVAAIMRSHGGDVSASAREGGGALVELRFPPRT